MLFGLDDHAVARIKGNYLNALARDRVMALRASALIGLGIRRTEPMPAPQ